LLKYERVMAVLKGEEPDRVPLYDMLFNDAIIRHFTGKTPQTGASGLPTVCEAIGKTLDMTRSITAPMEEGEWKIDSGDQEGFIYRRNRWTIWVEHRPFSDLEGAGVFIKSSIKYRKKWKPTKKIVDDYRNQFKEYAELTNGTVVLHHPSPVGIDTMFTWLGWENFSYLLAEDPDLLDEWFEAMLEQELRRVAAVADPKVSPAVLVYSDIASKNGLLLSPKFLRRTFVPGLKRLISTWQGHDISCLFHSDGDLTEIIDDIVEAGADGINPLEKTDRMDILTAYEQFGDRIYYAGGVDVKVLNVKGRDEVAAICREILETVPPKRLFLGSSTEISDDTPLENFLTMYNMVHKDK
jgi:uroporphyrinogen decarboxylase